MDPKTTISMIRELAEEAGNNPQFLTFHQIAEWCDKQMAAYEAKPAAPCRRSSPLPVIMGSC